MSRAPLSASRPRRGGTFRPQFEALEDRLAPGSLVGTLEPPFADLGNSVTAKQRDASDLAVLVGAAPNQQAATLPVSPEAAPAIDPLPPPPAPATPPSISRLPTVTIRPVTEFVDRSVVRGTSILIRTDRSVTFLLSASDVPAGVYTAWIPIFNPGETVPVAAGWVAGRVVGRGGHLTFAVNLREGEFISGHPVFPSGSLQDARRQEVRMVVRYHGPVDPARLREQLTTFEPGVAVDFLIAIHQAP